MIDLRTRLGAANGLIFDFDGTLAPNLDLPDMRRQVIDYTLDHGVPEAVIANAYIVEIIELARKWLTQSDANLAQRYQQSAHELITDFELAAAEGTTVYEDARQLLQRWRTRNGRSAIVTRNCRAAVVRTYPEVLEEVDVLLARDDVTHLKPDSRHLQEALSQLRTAAAHSIMIGDGQMDMRIGRAHSLYCIGVLGGSSSRAALLAAGAHCVVEHVATLAHALNEL
ncbi:MAG: HAD family hydrolase [Pseudomonadales bacterium]